MEIVTDILADPISFAIGKVMDEFKDSDDGRLKFLYEVLQRSEKMWKTIRIHWLEAYGKSYEQFCDECDKKRNIIFMSDEEAEDFNKAMELLRVIKGWEHES